MSKARPASDAAPPHVEGAFGIWLSKRSLELLEFPFRHTLTYQTGGWRLDALEAGKIVARIGDRRESFDIEVGDYLLAAGDDMYLSLKREGRDVEGRPLPPEDAARERAAEKTAKKATKKKTAKRGGSGRSKGA